MREWSTPARDAPADSAGYQDSGYATLVEKREPSREALIEMIQVLWQGDRSMNLAV